MANNDRKMHLTNPDVGHVTSAEAILLSEPHADWGNGRTIDLFAWDGELVAHIEFEDAKAATAAVPLRSSLARAIRPVFPADGAEREPVPANRYDVAAPAHVSIVYEDTNGWRGFDLVDDYRDIVATVGFKTEADALLARAGALAALAPVSSLLSGPDFMAQGNDFGGPSEVSGDYG